MRKFCSASGDGGRDSYSSGHGLLHGNMGGSGAGDGFQYSLIYSFNGNGGGCYPYQLIQYWTT